MALLSPAAPDTEDGNLAPFFRPLRHRANAARTSTQGVPACGRIGNKNGPAAPLKHNRPVSLFFRKWFLHGSGPPSPAFVVPKQALPVSFQRVPEVMSVHHIFPCGFPDAGKTSPPFQQCRNAVHRGFRGTKITQKTVLPLPDKFTHRLRIRSQHQTAAAHAFQQRQGNERGGGMDIKGRGPQHIPICFRRRKATQKNTLGVLSQFPGKLLT